MTGDDVRDPSQKQPGAGLIHMSTRVRLVIIAVLVVALVGVPVVVALLD